MKNILLFAFVFNCTIADGQNHELNLASVARMKTAQQQTVVLNNKAGIIPVTSLEDLRIASVHFNIMHPAVFDSIANKYSFVKDFNADTIQHVEEFNALHDSLKLFNFVLLEFSSQTQFSKPLLAFIKDLESNTRLVIILTGTGKNLRYFDDVKSPVIWCQSENAESFSVLAQVIFGGRPATKLLAENYGIHFKKGTGFKTIKTRLAYSLPEAVSPDHELSVQIDSIVYPGIRAHAAPSVVILVAKNGEVIFNKAYGKHTYDGSSLTGVDDIFDMASVTKVTATTPSVMRLYDRKLLSLDSPISKYVAVTRSIPDKSDIKIKEALLHEAGYTPYIKFYELLKPTDMSRDSSAAYPTPVADHYYLRANYFNEVMWPVTLASKVETRGQYVYSDVSMYMMKEVVETVSHQELNEYVAKEFYSPLGMRSTGYLPLHRFDKSRIVPTTENDNWFRNMLVQGYVNDPGSAMAGGVEGHAGLFSNANDLAIYYQMLLNKGVYGGRKYFNSSTVSLFTSRQSDSSGRGYGFLRVADKDTIGHKGYPSQLAFGHSGYTGTYVWVDPKYQLVFIYLSNRVYPDDNKTYGVPKVNMRTAVLDAIYKAIVGER